MTLSHGNSRASQKILPNPIRRDESEVIVHELWEILSSTDIPSGISRIEEIRLNACRIPHANLNHAVTGHLLQSCFLDSGRYVDAVMCYSEVRKYYVDFPLFHRFWSVAHVLILIWFMND